MRADEGTYLVGVIRDVTVDTTGTEQASAITEGLEKIAGISVMHSSDRVFVMQLFVHGRL